MDKTKPIQQVLFTGNRQGENVKSLNHYNTRKQVYVIYRGEIVQIYVKENNVKNEIKKEGYKWLRMAKKNVLANLEKKKKQL